MAGVGIRIAMLATAAMAVAAATGCANFENPLDWEESPRADRLIGSWRGVGGDDTGTRYRVARTADGALAFEAVFPPRTPASSGKDAYKHRATFHADLLGTGSVDVLQIDASSYEEFDVDGKSLGGAGSGYLFRRVKLTPKGDASVHRLNRTVLGQLAEAAFADSDFMFDVGEILGCLDDDVTMFAWRQAWAAIAENLDGDTKAKVIAALDGNDASEEFERQFERARNLKLDPYEELARLRTCLPRYLPGEALGQVLSSHADLAFAGGVDRYVRQ